MRDADQLLAAAKAEERKSRRVTARQPEPRIVDPKTHTKKWVNLTVAAEFLEMDRRALNAYLEEGRAAAEWKGRLRKMHIDEVVRLKEWLRRRPIAS
jgi:hypothetical protein